MFVQVVSKKIVQEIVALSKKVFFDSNYFACFMDHLKETISNLILLEMLFRFHILNQDSFPFYKRFKTIDYDCRHHHDDDNYYDWDDDSLDNMYQD